MENNIHIIIYLLIDQRTKMRWDFEAIIRDGIELLNVWQFMDYDVPFLRCQHLHWLLKTDCSNRYTRWLKCTKLVAVLISFPVLKFRGIRIKEVMMDWVLCVLFLTIALLAWEDFSVLQIPFIPRRVRHTFRHKQTTVSRLRASIVAGILLKPLQTLCQRQTLVSRTAQSLPADVLEADTLRKDKTLKKNTRLDRSIPPPAKWNRDSYKNRRTAVAAQQKHYKGNLRKTVYCIRTLPFQ